MKLDVLIACCLLVIVVCGEENKPDFCRTYECPAYSVTAEGKGYEVRAYEASVWVTQSYNATGWWSRWTEMNAAVQRLFKYIRGGNDQGKNIAMTVPVRITVLDPCGEEEVTDDCGSMHQLAFYIPTVYWKDVPEPECPRLRIERLPARTYYVRSFGGYALERGYVKEMEALKRFIPDPSTYVTSYFSMAGYNSPYELWGRHNEVWLQVKGEESMSEGK